MDTILSDRPFKIEFECHFRDIRPTVHRHTLSSVVVTSDCPPECGVKLKVSDSRGSIEGRTRDHSDFLRGVTLINTEKLMVTRIGHI